MTADATNYGDNTRAIVASHSELHRARAHCADGRFHTVDWTIDGISGARDPIQVHRWVGELETGGLNRRAKRSRPRQPDSKSVGCAQARVAARGTLDRRGLCRASLSPAVAVADSR